MKCMTVKRTFDLIISIITLTILLPVFIVIAIVIKSESAGPVFFRQARVGRNNRDFHIFKFRTMMTGSDRSGLLTIGSRDKRITGVGSILRKYKLDELPQLLNVIRGDMSIVGPRPEVRKYVNLYTTEQLDVLKVRPGITDYASIQFSDENDLLASASDPEEEYIKVILPAKLLLNLKYIRKRSFLNDLKIIMTTVRKVWFGDSGTR